MKKAEKFGKALEILETQHHLSVRAIRILDTFSSFTCMVRKKAMYVKSRAPTASAIFTDGSKGGFAESLSSDTILKATI